MEEEDHKKIVGNEKNTNEGVYTKERKAMPPNLEVEDKDDLIYFICIKLKRNPTNQEAGHNNNEGKGM